MVQKLAKCPFSYLPGKNSFEVIKGREWKINCFGLVKTSNLNISHFLLAKHVREMYFNECSKCGHYYFSSFWRSNFLHVTDHPREKLPPGRFYGVVISFALWSTQKLGTGTMLKWIHQKKVFLFYNCFVVKTSNVVIFTLTLNRVKLKCVPHVQRARFWHATVNSSVTTSIVFLRNRCLCTCLNVVCILIHANAPYLVTKINKLWNHLSSEYRREDPRVKWNKRSCY